MSEGISAAGAEVTGDSGLAEVAGPSGGGVTGDSGVGVGWGGESGTSEHLSMIWGFSGI